MKIIDLLNKIANNEEVPKKIKYNHETFIFNDNLKRYVEISNKDSDSCTYCLGGFFALDMSLNKEIEIIEEKPKKIEKIKLENGYVIDCDETGKHFLTTNRKDRNLYIAKLNEIIDNLNYLLEKSDSE